MGDLDSSGRKRGGVGLGQVLKIRVRELWGGGGGKDGGSPLLCLDFCSCFVLGSFSFVKDRVLLRREFIATSKKGWLPVVD